MPHPWNPPEVPYPAPPWTMYGPVWITLRSGTAAGESDGSDGEGQGAGASVVSRQNRDEFFAAGHTGLAVHGLEVVVDGVR